MLVGVIDVATDAIETPEDIVGDHRDSDAVCAEEQACIPCTNCGLAPLDSAVAAAKLEALGKGAKLAEAIQLREQFS